MSKKVFNMQGGRHSPAALSAFFNAAFYGDVAAGFTVVPTGSSGMNVIVNTGTGQIDTGLGYSRIIQTDATETVSLAAASAANPRNDLIVAYIDNAVTPTTSVTDNTNDVLKFKSVTGTPASTPADPSSSTIQSSVGAGNPYIILARVTVPTSATSIVSGNITDLRRLVTVLDGRINTSDKLSDGIVVTRHLGSTSNLKVPKGNIDFTTWPNGSGYAEIIPGILRIAWGSTVTSTIGTPAGSEANGTVTLPVTFSTAPIVILSTSDFPGGVAEYCSVGSITTTTFGYFAGHALTAGSSSTMTVRWVALGY